MHQTPASSLTRLQRLFFQHLYTKMATHRRGATSIPEFIPSKSKGREETKACICSWGKDCINLKTYFDSVGHALGGYKHADLTDTCDSQNFWTGVCYFLQPTRDKRDVIMARCQQSIEDKDKDIDKEKKAKPPRFEIANHHFPLQLIQAQQQPKCGNWNSAMTRERAIKLNCYADRDGVPFYSDTLFQFDSKLGKGKGDSWKKKNKNMIRKVPCVDSNTVKRIAALHQAGADERRRIERAETDERIRVERAATVERIRVERAETAERLRVEREEEQTRIEEEQRTPDEWNARLSQKDHRNNILSAENQSLSGEIESLSGENQSLKEQLKALKEQYNEMNRKRKGEQAKVNREKKRMKETHDANDVAGAGWHKVLKLLSRGGGLSRLTMFNDDWHKENKDAASKLWGYPSWKETKLHVKAYFPRDVYEVDTSYDPSKHVMVLKDGELSLPDVSKFEACLLCRLFYRTFTDQEIAGLIFGRHRTRVGQILKEWGARWGNVGEDLSCIDRDEHQTNGIQGAK